MAAALWAVIVFAPGGLGLSSLPGGLAHGHNAASRMNMSLIGSLASPLFGLQKSGNGVINVNNEDESAEEDWRGRADHLEKRVEGVVEDAANDITDKIDELEEVRAQVLAASMMGL